MTSETVTLDWLQGQEFLLKDRAGFPIRMTQPDGANGADLLPLSVIGCAAWDVISILQKQRQPVSGLHVSAESTREDAPPWQFRKITIRYRFTGSGLSESAVRRAVDLSEQKYCSTFATLRPAVDLDSSFEILEDLPPGEAAPGQARPETAGDAVAVVQRFNDALNAGDVTTMMRLMTEDCIFENTHPAPDGTRFEGRQDVQRFWESFFRTGRQPHIDIEEIFALQDRCVMRWVYRWLDAAGEIRHVRGVDIYRFRDGLISEKLSYVKG